MITYNTRWGESDCTPLLRTRARRVGRLFSSVSAHIQQSKWRRRRKNTGEAVFRALISVSELSLGVALWLTVAPWRCSCLINSLRGAGQRGAVVRTEWVTASQLKSAWPWNPSRMMWFAGDGVGCVRSLRRIRKVRDWFHLRGCS